MASMKLTNADYAKAARGITITVHVAPTLALWWRFRTVLAVWLVHLGCRVGGMGFEMGESK